MDEEEPEFYSKKAKKEKKKKAKKSKKSKETMEQMSNQQYMAYDELYPEQSYSLMFPTYDVPAPKYNYKHHYGLKSHKGTHSFNDLN